MTIDPPVSRKLGRAARIAHITHHVELPVRVPLLVGNVLEPRVSRDACVVDEDVEPRELAGGLCGHPFGLAGLREIGNDVRKLADTGCVAPAARDHACSLGDEQPDRLEADTARGARHEGALPFQSEVQSAASVSAWSRRSSSCGMGRPTGTVTDGFRATRTSRSTPPDVSRYASSPTALQASRSPSHTRAHYVERPRARSLIASRLRVDVRPCAALKEVDVGAWSGLTVHEVEDRYPEGFARWVERRCAGWSDGETYEQLGLRVVAGLREIAVKHAGEQILAVTHGGPIRSAAAEALHVPLHEVRDRLGPIDNAAVVRIDVRDGILEAVN